MSYNVSFQGYFEKIVLPFDDYGRVGNQPPPAPFLDSYDRDPQPADPSPQQQRQLYLEALAVKEELVRLESNFFACKEFYVVSTKWLNIWKRAVLYEDVSSQREPPPEIGRLAIPPANGDIVVNRPSVLSYDGNKSYLNVFLKPGIALNSEYVLVNEAVWSCLRRHGGNEIKRFMRPSPQGDMVDVSLVQFQVLYFFNAAFKRIQREQSKLIRTWVQVDKTTDFQTFFNFLTLKIVGEFKNSKYNLDRPQFLRIWKLDEQVTLGRWVDSIEKLCKLHKGWSYRLEIEGALLSEPGRTLLDLGLSPQTKVVAEIKEEGQPWTFFNKTTPVIGRCDRCETMTRLVHRCSCKVAYYCSKQCKQLNKENHRFRCQTDTVSEEEAKQYVKTAKSKMGIVGLRNLGNTCYMNSGLQCISHIPQLSHYILEGKYEKDLNLNNPLGSSEASLAKAYCQLVKTMYLGSEEVVAPVKFKKAMGAFQPIFAGYGQQDSSEFISYLLDGLHEDLNRIKKKEYVESAQNFDRPDHEMAAEAWESFKKRNDSVILDSMYGQYKSRVECNLCPNFSITFDPFLILQLPIPLKKKSFIEFYFSTGPFVYHAVKVPYETKKMPSLRECYEMACEEYKVPVQERFYAYAASNFFGEVVDQTQSVDTIRKAFKDRKSIVLRNYLPGESVGPSTIHVVVANYTTKSKSESYYYSKTTVCLIKIVPLDAGTSLKNALTMILASYAHIFGGSAEDPMAVFEPLLKQGKLKLTYSKPYGTTCVFCSGKCDGCELPFSEDSLGKLFGSKLEVELNWSKEAMAEDRDKKMEEKHGELTSGYSSVYYYSKSEGQSEPSAIEECLSLFEETEILDEDNKWYCNKCKDFVQARKIMQIYKLPQVLIVCLKRFKSSNRYSLTKNNSVIHYPHEKFRIGEYALNPMDKEAEYKLIGVSNHYGGLGGGHYTAYCLDQPSGDWFEFDDSSVHRMTGPREPASESYVLVYQRT